MKRMPKGYSLSELLMAMSIFGIVAAVIVSILMIAQKTWATGSGQAILTSQLRRSLDQMSQELAQSKVSEIQQVPADGRWYNTITFRVPQDRSVPADGSVLNANGDIVEWSDWITYRPGLVGVRTPAIFREIRPQGGGPVTSAVLASSISGLSFRRQGATSDIVEVSVTAMTVSETGQLMQRSLGTRVKLRN